MRGVSPHVMVKGPCPGGCGRRVRYDANTNSPRPPLCKWCTARLRREVDALVDSFFVVSKRRR